MIKLEDLKVGDVFWIYRKQDQSLFKVLYLEEVSEMSITVEVIKLSRGGGSIVSVVEGTTQRIGHKVFNNKANFSLSKTYPLEVEGI